MSAEMEKAAAELGLDDRYAPWLAVLDQAGDGDGPELPLYSEEDAGVLERLGVSGEDAAAVLATQPELSRSPGLSLPSSIWPRIWSLTTLVREARSRATSATSSTWP